MGFTLIQKIFQIIRYPFHLAYFLSNSRKDMPILLSSLYPRLFENTVNTGFDKHYVLHTGWAARKLKKIAPKKHTDISSSLYFVSIASGFLKMEFYDFRPAKLGFNDLLSKEGNLLSLPFSDNSIESISCMHVVEHIGLGRYGDPLDIYGDLKAVKEIIRVTKKGGSILFVVPVGKPRIAFNAHRIYEYRQVKRYFKGCTLKEFSLIPDDDNDGMIVENPSSALINKQKYGCGCFWFVKK